MNNKLDSIIIKMMLWINTILLLASCQSPNIINNTVSENIESGKAQVSKKIPIASFNNITDKITDLYTKKSLADYIGDTDKEKIATATKKAADTNEPQLFMNEESGIKGKAEVIQTKSLFILETGKKEGTRECKIIRQTIILKDKREVTESIELCKGPDGWG